MNRKILLNLTSYLSIISLTNIVENSVCFLLVDVTPGIIIIYACIKGELFRLSEYGGKTKPGYYTSKFPPVNLYICIYLMVEFFPAGNEPL